MTQHTEDQASIAEVAAPGRLLGDYTILDEIGRGGMGIVYRARQQTLGRDVALKVMAWAALADHRQLARFQNEARAAAGLHRSHIVPVYSVGVERGIHYYAMQYIPGPTLAQVLEHLRSPDVSRTSPTDDVVEPGTGTISGRPPWDQDHRQRIPKVQSAIALQRCLSVRDYCRMVARWGIQVAEGLDHAHQQGVVHRDIKPANLLLEDRDSIWITDFGLARLDVGSTATDRGDLSGTLLYMSPEQLAGHGTPVDHRTDIYSLGATLYEALTLRPPIAEQRRGELLLQANEIIPVTPRRISRHIPVDLESIVLKAMEQDRTQRYDTAMELADDLRRFLNERPVRARRASIARRARKWAKRHVGLVVLGIVAWVLISITASLSAVLVWRSNAATREALGDQETALQRAQQKAQLARQAVDQMYDDVASQWIASDQPLTPLQREFLDQAASIYRQLAQQTIAGRLSQAAVADAWYRVFSIRTTLGDASGASAAAERAMPLYEELVKTEPDDTESLARLVTLNTAFDRRPQKSSPQRKRHPIPTRKAPPQENQSLG